MIVQHSSVKNPQVFGIEQNMGFVMSENDME